MSALFVAGSLRAVEMTPADVSGLQRFFEANPEYHVAVTGEAPAPDEAQKEFDLSPPAGWPFEKRWLVSFVARDESLIGVGDVISNLFVPGVWHVGLFMVATSLRGSGAAHSLYHGLESWMRGSGARWLRLGVVEGNLHAERFWEKLGYTEVRKRQDVQVGKQFNTLRVMVKPLGEAPLAEYLAAIPRDRPE